MVGRKKRLVRETNDRFVRLTIFQSVDVANKNRLFKSNSVAVGAIFFGGQDFLEYSSNQTNDKLRSPLLPSSSPSQTSISVSLVVTKGGNDEREVVFQQALATVDMGIVRVRYLYEGDRDAWLAVA